jgi:glycine cleavage system T protein (aminomethyltransferase)
MSEALARTPLHALHAELGARFTPFAGYEMPVQYGAGLRAEHLWTRSHAGLFDVSHMGQLRVRGPDLAQALEAALPVDFSGWPMGLQKYSLLLNERGGIEDDLMIARLEGEVAIVVNAACKEKDLGLLRSRCPQLEFELLDRALLALQGPQAEEALASLSSELPRLRFQEAGTFRIADSDCFVTRSGYTGEDGFEISVPAQAAERLARALLAHPAVKPVGLGARDTLRLEAGLPLYGQDMDAGTTPQEAGLAWAIPPSRRAAVSSGTPPMRRLGGFVGLGRVPIRHGAAIVDPEGTEVGVVTSGTVSPSLGRPIALAYVAKDAGEPLAAVVRGERHEIARANLPFVPKRYKRRAGSG